MTRFATYLILATFFASGCAALLYQLVWQRYLFAGLGVDIDSVTLIVSTFMLGIGVGGALGGWMADRWGDRRLVIYALAELSLAIYGALSPLIFAGLQALGGEGWSYETVSILAMAVVLVPTTVMGTTLPILTMHFDDILNNVGMSVGMLYFFNTMGAAVGAWFAAYVLFVSAGLNATAYFAAVINASCFAFTMLAAVVLRSATSIDQNIEQVAK